MHAWQVNTPAPIDCSAMELVERPPTDPEAHEVRVRVTVCGICRTDLHIVEGDLPPHRPRVTPGHEIVGRVEALGSDARRFSVGERVGVAWLATTCGVCRFCRRGAENLCPKATFNGWDHHGGYAESVVVDERYAYCLPDELPDDQVAPLLCAGIIGYRALRASALPPGGRLGIFGFGASAHITAQIALAEGADVVVGTRSPEARKLAERLGASWTGPAEQLTASILDAAILFAPAGDLVPVVLRTLDRGATLAVAGIHLTDVPPLRYREALYGERVVRSVTANTRADGEELLRLAPRVGVRVATTAYPFEEADRALRDLAHGRVNGAAIIEVAGVRP